MPPVLLPVDMLIKVTDHIPSLRELQKFISSIPSLFRAFRDGPRACLNGLVDGRGEVKYLKRMVGYVGWKGAWVARLHKGT